MTALRTDQCLVCGTSGASESRLDDLLRRCPTCTFTWTTRVLAAPEELYDSGYFEGRPVRA